MQLLPANHYYFDRHHIVSHEYGDGSFVIQETHFRPSCACRKYSLSTYDQANVDIEDDGTL